MKYRRNAHDKKYLLKKAPYCYRYKTRLDAETATVDHLHPVSKGGTNGLRNKVLACRECNQRRGNNMPPAKLLRARR